MKKVVYGYFGFWWWKLCEIIRVSGDGLGGYACDGDSGW
jgi:hypothetical protein